MNNRKSAIALYIFVIPNAVEQQQQQQQQHQPSFDPYSIWQMCRLILPMPLIGSESSADPWQLRFHRADVCYNKEIVRIFEDNNFQQTSGDVAAAHELKRKRPTAHTTCCCLLLHTQQQLSSMPCGVVWQ
ncbi:hypothetical protein DAPPUDRAFT_262081 [Daphnia pulex]|uniref:Uncharacterized protein n=1 Tax=Daphnia pulex TaxID=6669 RepID=E9HMA8_DAPPU|nr:hypothetical protein DAPPUDRAFT_262081 [Daphnia pulex]|eukprot:EFX67135.1 hypothetical protein DAPPUDRAFT_262081 [Daphnia pulex]